MTQTSMLDILRSHPFSREMTDEQRAALATIAEPADIEPDRIIFGSGERSGYFYLLLSGTAFLEFQTPAYTICIQQLGAGEAFGWSALVDEPYRAFQVRARVACRVVRIPADRLLEACEADDRMGSLVFRQVAGLIARRLRAAESRFTEFCSREMEAHASDAEPHSSSPNR